jgi:hypothetical protein
VLADEELTAPKDSNPVIGSVSNPVIGSVNLTDTQTPVMEEEEEHSALEERNG